MAIWQYKIFIAPKEEIASYFQDAVNIDLKFLDEVDYWYYSAFSPEEFKIFEAMLPLKKSWSNDMIIYGDEGSNCLDILLDKNKITEVSARIDLRLDYRAFLSLLCEFAQEHDFTFVNNELKILAPDIHIVSHDIEVEILRYNKDISGLNR